MEDFFSFVYNVSIIFFVLYLSSLMIFELFMKIVKYGIYITSIKMYSLN